MKAVIYFFILQLLLLITAIEAPSQSGNVKFRRYSMADGLSQGKINCICQDSEGYMWFGTDNGLNRFDGYEFTQYLSNPNDSTKISGQVIALYEDGKKRLWVGCGHKGALLMYNKEDDNFIPFLELPYSNSEYQFHVVNAIEENNDGDLWIGTTMGLYQFNPDKHEPGKWYKHDEHNMNSLGANKVLSLCFDSFGNLWLGNFNGLELMDTKTAVFYHFRHNDEMSYSIGQGYVPSIYEHSDKILFIATKGSGLNVLTNNKKNITPEHAKFIKFENSDSRNNTISSNYLNHICEDKNKTLWICTHKGLSKVLIKKENVNAEDFLSFSSFVHNPQDEESLNYNFVKCAYSDRANVLWAGTNTGLNKAKNYKFNHYKQKIPGQGLMSNKVQAIYEDSKGHIWLGTSKGINVFDRQTNAIASLPVEFEAVLSISEDGDGNMWFGSWDAGLMRYNPTTKQYKRFYQNANDSTSINGGQVYNVFVDSDGDLWVSLWGKGLDLYDNKKKIFIRKNTNPENKYVTTIFEDNNKNLWIGSFKGLYKLKDKKKGEFTLFDKIDSEGKNLIFNCIAQENNHDMWAGTQHGLFKINLNDNSSRKFTMDDGLPSNNIMGITIDDSGNLWVSSLKGLSKLRFKNSETEIINFTTEHGLQSKEFVANSFLKCRNGQMIFGGINGFNIFRPDSILENNVVPHVVITNLLLYNKQVQPGDTIRGDVVLQKNISLTKQITLSHYNNFLTIQFAALHYLCPEQNLFSYKMEGFDKNWNFIGNERKVSFIGLKSGNYEFKIKAANSDGIWSENYTSLVVKILPPWWKTVRFQITLITILSFVVFMLIRLRTYRLKKQRKILQKTVDLRTIQLKEMNLMLKERQEILEQKNSQISDMAKQLHEADQKQLRFFTNISHEFRTPLTLIISPLEKFSADWEKEKIADYIKLIQRNAKKLLKLVNQILDFRKLDQKAKNLSVSNNNIIEFVNEIVNAFQIMAETKNIELTVNSEQSNIFNSFWFDPDVMEKILYNLISNALKYTPEEGKVSIQLSVISNQSAENSEQLTVNSNQLSDGKKLLTIHSSLLIKVVDTGIGIKPENLDKIFERFYRIQDNTQEHKEGTGIGLAYTKELIELHKGTIEVDSEVNKGSMFTLNFPLKLNELDNTEQTSPAKSYSIERTRLMIENEFMEIDAPDNPLPFEPQEIAVKEKTDFTKLLLVEDNPDMQLLIANELNDTYSVLLANNGAEGFDIAIHEMPDIIISDIMMPVMDGIEFCKKIKNHNNTSHIPVVLLTAKSGEDNIMEGLSTGADDYISKPFSSMILKAKLKNILETRKLLREKFSQSFELKPEEITSSIIDQEFLSKAIEVVVDNLSDYDFTNDQFIRLLGYGRTTAYNKIKALTNQSVSEFINSIRLKKAAKLLLQGDNNISKVAIIVGFKYRETFYRSFTAMYGKTPGQFIKDHS